MDKSIQQSLADIHSEDRELQGQAFLHLLSLTDQPVDWAYEAWDGLVTDLGHGDNHVRAIAAQLLCNLAKSDPQNRMETTLPALLALTKDARFVTARHCMQSLWKVGAAGGKQRSQLVAGIEQRFKECSTEKNCTLIRYDIIQSLRNVYGAAKDESVKEKALALIETEPNLKYRKKYAGLWRTR
jgi:hypothetical protein